MKLDPKQLNCYVQLAVRTESPFPTDLNLDYFTYRLLHGAVGVMTEAGELFEALAADKLDPVNVNEEIGDSAWYTALLCDVLGIPFENLVMSSFQFSGPTCDNYSEYTPEVKKDCLHRAVARMVAGAGVILDQCKRKIYYRTMTIKAPEDRGFEKLTKNDQIHVASGESVKVPYEIDRKKCEKALQQIVTGLSFASRSGFGRELAEICERNILKLAKRYPDKFSEVAAVERNLEAERYVLETASKLGVPAHLLEKNPDVKASLEIAKEAREEQIVKEKMDAQ
jgi:hypothetical protein